MSRKSIDKDHIRLSLSGLGTDHPNGDAKNPCFTTNIPFHELYLYRNAAKVFNADSLSVKGVIVTSFFFTRK